jgi:polyhydroxybutyrate depolymerase
MSGESGESAEPSLERLAGSVPAARPRESAATSRVLPLVLLSLASCASGPSDPPPFGSALAPGEYDLSLTHQSRSRYYLLRVPSQAATGAPLPVLLALHGGGGNAEQFKSDSGFDGVGDREGLLVVHPGGSGLLPRTLLTWNAGTDCCGFALEQNVDDVGFLLALVEDLSRRTPVDAKRVYVAGHSNGGMMAYRIGAEAGDRIAAVVPVGGAMMIDAFDPPRPVPLLHIHSVDDPRALYEGGLGPPFPIGGGQVLHRPVMEGIAAWVERNGCTPSFEVTEERVGAPGSANAGQSARLLSWDPCGSGAPVLHWTLEGVGHGWPGRVAPPAQEAIIGPSTTLISAAEEAWAFFRDHRLP